MNVNRPQLSLCDVTCDLGSTRILHGVNLSLKRGQITVVLGASGAGKSTLLRAVAGFEAISNGEISTPSGVISSPARTLPPEMRRIGIVVQSNALFPHMTACNNVRFGLANDDSLPIAMRWLERVQLEHRAHAYPHELSGGEQQRVALARALAREPDVVLLDEAFSSLDQQLRKSVRAEAKQLLRETNAAVLAVTHDPDEAMELADTVTVLDHGKVLQSGDPEELYWRPQSVTAARLLGEINQVHGRWEGGQFVTAFGSIATDMNGAANALIRPSAITAKPDQESTTKVTATEFVGGQNFVTLRAHSGEQLRLAVGIADDLTPGAGAKVAFDNTRIGWAN